MPAVAVLLLLPAPLFAGEEAEQHILFTSLAQGDTNGDGILNNEDEEVYLFNTKGEAPRRLTTNGFRERAVTLAPNGRNFVYLGDPIDTVYLADTRLGQSRAVLSTSASMNSQQFINLNPLLRRLPWSVDGSRIYLSFAYPVNQWYAMKLSGPLVDIGPAVWSQRQQRYSLVEQESERLQKVYDVQAHGFFPSPDGQRALYIDGNRGGAYLLSLRNGTRTMLLSDRLLYHSTATWSPSGRSVVLYRSNLLRQQDDLLVVDVEAKRVRWRFSDALRAQERWSPDGRLLAFTAPPGIGVYDFERQRIIMSPAEGFGLRSPIWSADNDEFFAIAADGQGGDEEMGRIVASRPSLGSRRVVGEVAGLKRLLYLVPQP
ncbi:MAG: PD40 domain-containing protein [Candidatus Tectomicrobia bacterium]|nr:PD40 domain-containing protein [Candidatus Tectomicrobia bacterium]